MNEGLIALERKLDRVYDSLNNVGIILENICNVITGELEDLVTQAAALARLRDEVDTATLDVVSLQEQLVKEKENE